jgi:hypothetical protein
MLHLDPSRYPTDVHIGGATARLTAGGGCNGPDLDLPTDREREVWQLVQQSPIPEVVSFYFASYPAGTQSAAARRRLA